MPVFKKCPPRGSVGVSAINAVKRRYNLKAKFSSTTSWVHKEIQVYNINVHDVNVCNTAPVPSTKSVATRIMPKMTSVDK